MPGDPRATSAGADAVRWDAAAIRSGAVICLVLAVPFTIIGAVVDGARAVSFFAALLGFVIGSGCAAWVQRAGTPLSHAIVTAVGTYVAAQSIFILVRLVTDREVNWFGAFFTLSLVSFGGLVGGFLGSRLRARGVMPTVRR